MPVQHVIWIVDNDIQQFHTLEPMREPVRRFVSSLARSDYPMREENHINVMSWGGLSERLMIALRRVDRWSIEYARLDQELNRDRGVEFIIYYFEDWEAVKALLSGEDPSRGHEAWRIWPSLIISDLYDGVQEAQAVRSSEELAQLAGAKFRDACQQHQIPCIVVTSFEDTISNFELDWQEAAHRGGLFYLSRARFGQIGEEFLTRLWGHLKRRFWIPEFRYELSGIAHPGRSTFEVRLFEQGREVSVVPRVTATQYSCLYIWAWGSVLARAKGWEVDELRGWAASTCPAVSVPRKKDVSGKAPQFLFNLNQNFSKTFRGDELHDLNFTYPEDPNHIGFKVLSANILRLDTPPAGSLPGYYTTKEVFKKLEDSLREILPPAGVKWLRSHQSATKSASAESR